MPHLPGSDAGRSLPHAVKVKEGRSGGSGARHRPSGGRPQPGPGGRSAGSILSRLCIVAAFALIGCAGAAAAPVQGGRPQTVEDRYLPDPPGFRVETWVSGLEVPWSLVFLPDGRALVSERPGRIRLIGRDGALRREPYAVLPVQAVGEGGLMGLALHPDFANQPYLYVMYTARQDGEVVNRVVRLRHQGDTAALDRVILDGIPAARYHDGGALAFGPDGMLYVATGDATHPEHAQQPESLAGKILRLTPDGGVPQDNPFPGPFPGSPVWSYGHRNVQGLAWDPETGALFASEHGPSGEFGLHAYDEINVIRKGGNYGWPQVVGDARVDGYIPPLVAWPAAAVPPGGIAFLGGALYIATLRSEALVRIALAHTDEGYRVEAIDRLFATGPSSGRYGRLRAAVPGPDDALYVLTSNRDGRGSPAAGDDRILRLTAADRLGRR